ncbi:hypothetical protein [Brevibacterium luteolum]|uniref:hypothetical protein n=1 Tax=Brevibacterium luteolum TaxID=199591 RepID=UPI001C212F8B|nr:hypothetical protein [Brevibacterium luteolum]MBU8578614.1 hypothetical protein [Brevibacterium luteolum]
MFTEELLRNKPQRKQIQEKLIKFATRTPAFMHVTDFRENTLQGVITKTDTVITLETDDGPDQQ